MHDNSVLAEDDTLHLLGVELGLEVLELQLEDAHAVVETNILADLGLPKLIRSIRFDNCLVPVLLLELRDGEEVLKQSAFRLLVHHLDLDASLSQLAAPHADVLQAKFFYLLVLLEDLAGLERGRGIGRLNERVNTIKERK